MSYNIDCATWFLFLYKCGVVLYSGGVVRGTLYRADVGSGFGLSVMGVSRFYLYRPKTLSRKTGTSFFTVVPKKPCYVVTKKILKNFIPKKISKKFYNDFF